MYYTVAYWQRYMTGVFRLVSISVTWISSFSRTSPCKDIIERTYRRCDLLWDVIHSNQSMLLQTAGVGRLGPLGNTIPFQICDLIYAFWQANAIRAGG